MSELLSQHHAIPRCFCCGPENPSGIKLRFTKEDDDTVTTTFTAPDDWTGWGRILHGGFQTLLLDETMSWAAYGASDAILLRAIRRMYDCYERAPAARVSWLDKSASQQMAEAVACA